MPSLVGSEMCIRDSHIKGHVEIGFLNKFGALKLDRDQVMTLETWLKIHTNLCNFVTASPKTIKTLNFFS